MDEIERSNAIQRFIMNASPDNWMDYADELKGAADLLWSQSSSGRTLGFKGVEESDLNNAVRSGINISSLTHRIDKPSVLRSFILLSGLALENVMKGLAVAGDPTLINRGELDKRLKTHRLLDLVSLCKGLELTTAESKVCSIAQEAIPYWGRYPVPRTFESLTSEQVADFDYHETFNSLYARLHRDTYFAIRDGWDSGAGSTLGSFRSSQYEPEMQAELDRINRRGAKGV